MIIIFFNAGIGIYVTYSLGTGTSVNSLTSQPPNSYAIVDTNTANRCSYIRFEMYCCSNSTSYIPNFSYPGHDGSIRFNSYAGSSTYAGCYRLQFYYNYRDYFYLNYPGIYTCSYVDTRGNYIAMNIGLYPEEFNSESFKIIVSGSYLYKLHRLVGGIGRRTDMLGMT